MRIISGKLGGRRFTPPAHMPHTRPTTDVAKEGLFNILQNRIDFEHLKCLDLFGGTGSISYELISRGASHVTIVEKDNKQVQFIQHTSTQLGIDSIKIVKQDVFHYLDHCQEQFDFIFAGPPYALTSIDRIPGVIFEKRILTTGGLFVLEHTPRNSYINYEGFERERNYGTTVFSFFVS